MEDDTNQNQSNETTNAGETIPPENSELPLDPGTPSTDIQEKSIGDIEEELRKEKGKELELIKLKNQRLEEQLRGRGIVSPQIKSKEETEIEECEKFLEGTGMSIR